ncbi:MAG TPA: transcription antitermination factor NusB [Acidimicrobiales bacterium]|nr:transcription antitermination factor NusB [Acidimicrobiales bacterium]
MGFGGSGIGSRRESRERAMTLLYEAEAKGCVPLGAVLDDLVVHPEPFTADLVAGVSRHQDDIDGLIATSARGWALARMPVVDRSLLRIATYELAHRPDIPVGAVISEAVELAKAFSTDDSGRFVNGVLGKIAAEVRPGEVPVAEGPPAATVGP